MKLLQYFVVPYEDLKTLLFSGKSLVANIAIEASIGLEYVTNALYDILSLSD